MLAILALAQFLRTDDRGIVAILAEWSELRVTLELEKVPHFTTLFHARKRLAKKGVLKLCCAQSSEQLKQRA